MGFISELGQAIERISELEKVGIFCFTAIIFLLVIRKETFSSSFIVYSMAMIILFIYMGLHRTKQTKILQHPTRLNESITETQTGYNFESILLAKHPYNVIRKLAYFFLIIGTVLLGLAFFHITI